MNVTLADVVMARERLRGAFSPSPLVRLDVEGDAEIWLKLENLHPIGSFKLRGAGNALLAAAPEELRAGAVTASAGNMAQGVAWWARRLGIPATAVVPERAPAAKTLAVERLGGRVVRLPFDRWWSLLDGSETTTEPGCFIHPVANPLVIAGNGTLGLELVEALPHIDTVLVPWGGGGLASGIATVLRELRPEASVIGCEVETATPLTASLAARRPMTVAHTPSFVDGIGGKSMLPAMWPLAERLIAGSAVVALDQVRQAIRLLVARHRVVAEGAGAVSVAAALADQARGITVCVVSGGNIQADVLAAVLKNADQPD
ncbi:MAG TPA: pyridoxal-phosphate dependent enzyme [Gemmatimonadales bacterium]